MNNILMSIRALVVILVLVCVSGFLNVQQSASYRSIPLMMRVGDRSNTQSKVATAAIASIIFFGGSLNCFANDNIPHVPIYTQRTNELQNYADIQRGFKMMRPFGFNEFQGQGSGYVVKFASLFEVDENVVVGSAPASAGKTSIVDYGNIKDLGEKLASKRGGKLLEAEARETEGYTFYKFKFENPLDMNLPRTGPKDKRPTVGIELYQLCVGKGRLWSVQATTNDRLYPSSEKKLQASLDSFVPKL
jgi:hypothetical protein